MGMYTWLSDSEFEKFATAEDKDINEVLQQVRKVDPVWYIDERKHVIKRWFRKPVIQSDYTVYSQFYRNGIFSGTEVYVQASVSTKKDVLNFFYGLNNGLHYTQNNINCEVCGAEPSGECDHPKNAYCAKFNELKKQI